MGIPALLVALVLAGSGPEPTRPAAIVLEVDSLSGDAERPVSGTVATRCTARGSVLAFDLSGLVPSGRYSIWVFLFDQPRVTFSPADAVAAGALGGRGGRHEFVADGGGRARLAVVHPVGPLSAFGAVPGCLLDTPQWKVVGGFHPRGVRAGLVMPAPGEIVAQFGITYRRRQGGEGPSGNR